MKCWHYAYRPKAGYFFFHAPCVIDNPTAVGYLPDNLAFLFSNKIEFRNKVAAVSEVVQNEMFVASWNIKIPKCFAYQFLNNSVMVFLF